MAKKRDLKQQAIIAKACDQFVQEAKKLAKAGMESQRMPAILNRLIDGLGGETGIADRLIEDFRRVRGETLTEEERLMWQPKDQVIQRYYDSILKLVETNDSKVTADITNMQDDDLRAVILETVMHAIKNDPSFRREVAIESLREDPGLLEEVIGDGSRFGLINLSKEDEYTLE